MLRALVRSVLLALAAAIPAFCAAQQAGSTGAATSPPAVGSPSAQLPGGALPGGVEPIPGLTGADTGLGPMPADYTRYGVAAGIGASDNINLSATQRKAQALTAANFFFDLIRTGSRLQLSALGNFSDIDYLEHAYGNQVLGRFDGIANLDIWKNHLKWLVRDDYGDTQVDIQEALTPRNLQRVNVFSTGPDLMLRPTISSFVELQGLYSRSAYQTSPFDGQSEMGSFTLGHEFSPSSSLSLVGQVQQEHFEDRLVNTNYEIRRYFGHYELKGARTHVDLRGGLGQSNDTGSWKSSPIVGLSITRDISPYSSISLSGGRDYSNATKSFAALASSLTGDITVGPAAQTTANAVRTYGNASWGFHRLRTTFDVYGGWERNEYARGSQFDVIRSDVGLRLGRRLSQRFSANILASAYRARYVEQAFTDTIGTLGGNLIYRPGKWVVISGRYDHQFRRPSGGVSHDLGYDENRVFIMIGYYPHSSGTGAPGESGMGGGIP